jgi:hypothetical protein
MVKDMVSLQRTQWADWVLQGYNEAKMMEQTTTSVVRVWCMHNANNDAVGEGKIEQTTVRFGRHE